jgi:hypothetical protein
VALGGGETTQNHGFRAELEPACVGLLAVRKKSRPGDPAPRRHAFAGKSPGVKTVVQRQFVRVGVGLPSLVDLDDPFTGLRQGFRCGSPGFD